MVLDVTLQMIGELRNPLAQQRDLHFRRSRILRVTAMGRNDGCFLVSSKGHGLNSFTWARCSVATGRVGGPERPESVPFYWVRSIEDRLGACNQRVSGCFDKDLCARLIPHCLEDRDRANDTDDGGND